MAYVPLSSRGLSSSPEIPKGAATSHCTAVSPKRPLESMAIDESASRFPCGVKSDEEDTLTPMSTEQPPPLSPSSPQSNARDTFSPSPERRLDEILRLARMDEVQASTPSPSVSPRPSEADRETLIGADAASPSPREGGRSKTEAEGTGTPRGSSSAEPCPPTPTFSEGQSEVIAEGLRFLLTNHQSPNATPPAPIRVVQRSEIDPAVLNLLPGPRAPAPPPSSRAGRRWYDFFRGGARGRVRDDDDDDHESVRSILVDGTPQEETFRSLVADEEEWGAEEGGGGGVAERVDGDDHYVELAEASEEELRLLRIVRERQRVRRTWGGVFCGLVYSAVALALAGLTPMWPLLTTLLGSLPGGTRLWKAMLAVDLLLILEGMLSPLVFATAAYLLLSRRQTRRLRRRGFRLPWLYLLLVMATVGLFVGLPKIHCQSCRCCLF